MGKTVAKIQQTGWQLVPGKLEGAITVTAAHPLADLLIVLKTGVTPCFLFFFRFPFVNAWPFRESRRHPQHDPHRTGAAVLHQPDGSLAGIFTHGDFARCFPEHPDLASRSVGDFMTRSPIVIKDDKLAAEVLAIMRTHRIDDLVVVDDLLHPLGLVDSQDLSRLKIL